MDFNAKFLSNTSFALMHKSLNKSASLVVNFCVASGVQLIVLLALNNDGAPSYDHQNAKWFADIGAPVFACTPDQFPDLMATALSKQDISAWAAKENLILKK